MDNSNLKINATKYSGLPLGSLKFLIKTEAPIDQFRKREIWKELYHRYFTQGRLFNLYSILRGHPIPFGNTISWELSSKEVEIPKEHAEDYIKNLLDFIYYVERQVLASDNIKFEWQLHELIGIKSMIERVRDAKITDMNTRQKVNLFIDKINNTRKKALIKIEEVKTQNKSNFESSHVSGQETKGIIISEDKSTLMKQELLHLGIAMSKVTKGHWLEMIKDLHIYYPEDQKKIVRHGIKKYGFDTTREQPCQTFIENRDIRNTEINMVWALLDGIRKSGFIYFLEKLSITTLNGFLIYIRDWYFEAENANEDSYDELRREVLYSITNNKDLHKYVEYNNIFYEARKLYIEYVLMDIDNHFWIIEKHEYGKLSLFLDESPCKFSKNIQTWDLVKIHYNMKGTSQIIVPERRLKIITTIELYYEIYSVITSSIATNQEAYLRLGNKLTISEDVPLKYREKISRFCHLPLTLKIDPDCTPSHDSYSERKSNIESIFMYKFIKSAIDKNELQWLYATDEGYAFFKDITTVMRSKGMFHSHEDYVAEFFEDAIPFFDFKDPDQLIRFFKLDFRSKYFYGPHSKVKREVVDRIIQKLQDEIPHELLIVYEFFDGIDKEYSEFTLHPEYDGLSSMELLLLQHQGIEIGKENHYKGIKETQYGTEVHYTPEEARNRFIIDYYKNYSGSS